MVSLLPNATTSRVSSGASNLLDRLVHPLVDVWLPPEASTERELSDVLRMRIVSALLQALAVLALGFGTFDLCSGLVVLSLTLYTGVPLAFASLARMRWGASMEELGFTSSATLYVVLLANASLNGGLEAPSMYFLPLVPTLALLMAARRLARAWVGVCMGTALLFFLVEGPLAQPFPRAMPLDRLALNQVLVLMASCVMVYGAFLLNVAFSEWMQARLLEAEAERLDRILDAAGDAILRVDAGGVVATGNAAAQKLFGVSYLPGCRVVELLPAVEELARAAGSVELDAIGPDGLIRVEATHTVFGDGHVLVVRDIRERMLAQRELEQARDAAESASLAKSRFLASMSHELRTPLNAVIGYAEMVGEEIDAGEPPEDSRDLVHIVGSARHLLALIDQVLDLAKVEAGRMEVELREVPLCALLAELDTVGRTLAVNGSNQWCSSLPRQPVTVLIDEVRVRQIVLNLLSNAAKFCERGTITLDVVYTEECLTLTVADTGIGMTPEQLAAVWQEFVQAERSTARVYGGTGLGLPLAHRLTQLLGGTLDVTSSLGVGTTFVVGLPVRTRCALPRPGVGGCG